MDVGLVRRIEERLGVRCLVPPDPQIVAALGAALTTEEKVRTETVKMSDITVQPFERLF